MEQEDKFNILIIWRGKHLKIEMNSNSDLKELGLKLVELTKIKPETMKLLIPLSTNKGSKLVSVFSAEHSSLSLRESGILEGKSIRMMGVSEDEIQEVSQNNAKADMRIIGFDEEERRLRQRSLDRLQTSLKLPQGPYVFCDFRTLQIPGIKLNPPASEALRRMHMLACDPGIIAIMNKHHWRVGIMTEMAPVGYVGISPKCLLGFNKNHGEEISLRLRTDDLKGFRKYESIKKTLLHELAHMVHSEHDADFYALDKQLNQEAISLDWTKSKAYTLSSKKTSFLEEELHDYSSNENVGMKLGGLASKSFDSARQSSVAAAYTRYLSASNHSIEESQNNFKDGATRTSLELEDYNEDSAEPDPDDSLIVNDIDMQTGCPTDEPDPDETLEYKTMCEPDPDDFSEKIVNSMKETDPDDSADFIPSQSCKEPDPDDSLTVEVMQHCREPDPDASLGGSMLPCKEVELCHCEPERINRAIANEDDTSSAVFVNDGRQTHKEPDPDDSESGENTLGSMGNIKPIPGVSQEANNNIVTLEPDPDDNMDTFHGEELLVVEEPVAVICSRLQKAIEMLRSEVPPAEATSSIRTLFKIIRNVIEHPNEVKFRKLRKGNPLFQRNVANYKAAMDVLAVVGFCEDIIADEVGRSESYLVLKRNDPGLLWLAKSTLEVCIV